MKKCEYSNKPHSEFYLKHCINPVDYDIIVSRYRKLMTPFYRKQLGWFLLSYSPCFCKESKK